MSRVESIDSKALWEILDINVLAAFLCAKAAIARLSTRHGCSGDSGLCLVSDGDARRRCGICRLRRFHGGDRKHDDRIGARTCRRRHSGQRRRAGTDRNRSLFPGRLERITQVVPLARPSTVEEITESILFLVSEAPFFHDRRNPARCGGTIASADNRLRIVCDYL
jgi:hypothetical protein